ncbi:hypothetical protein GCM10020254_72980 [Streptomyces goshikiensis]
MLDRTGRVQLPHKFLQALGMEHRVAVDLASDHIAVRPDATEDPEHPEGPESPESPEATGDPDGTGPR